MKSLRPPAATDVANLRVLARNTSLSSHPALAGVVRDILTSYVTYRVVSGNAKAVGAPQPLPLTAALKTALKGHYNSPPQSIEEFISGFRKKGSPDVCPMCGSPKTGELDHVFPKTVFAEFSFFSLNLVPACDCNTKRRTDYVGQGANDRVLHPYFDGVMRQRLVRAQFEPSPNHGYNRPAISLVIVIPTASANYAPVKYHFDNVVARTDVLNHMDASWPKLANRPTDYFDLPDGRVSFSAFRRAVQSALGRYDRHSGTPNNWDSMLFAGVLEDDEVMRFLRQRVWDIRNGTYIPRDDT
jgi:hypothetical protein